jgi:hypothetical protein
MNSKSMAGWIGFAGMLLLIVGSIDFFQGLIALFEDEYFVVTASGFLAVDLTAWGWIMLIWGVLLVLAGLGLLGGQGWARWFAIVVVSLNFIAQLGFLGNSQYPLWSLTVVALNIIVLYALTARWSESTPDLRPARYRPAHTSRPSRDIVRDGLPITNLGYGVAVVRFVTGAFSVHVGEERRAVQVARRVEASAGSFVYSSPTAICSIVVSQVRASGSTVLLITKSFPAD